MLRVVPDVGRNRLVITLSGRPTRDEMQALEAELPAVLSRLRAPIDVLNDIRDLESLADIDQEIAGRLAKALKDFGVRKVVRVVGKSKAAAVEMARLGRAIGTDGHLAYSEADAEALLTHR